MMIPHYLLQEEERAQELAQVLGKRFLRWVQLEPGASVGCVIPTVGFDGLMGAS